MVARTHLNITLYVYRLSCFFFKELKRPQYTLHIKRVTNASRDRACVTETECNSVFENLSSYIKLCRMDASNSSLAVITAVALTLVDSNEEGTRDTKA
jgi:hypothetical protein